MAIKIRRVEYSYAVVTDEPGAAYELLSQLESLGEARGYSPSR